MCDCINDPRINKYTEYVIAMQRLQFHVMETDDGPDPLGQLGKALYDLAQVMDRWYQDHGRLLDITAQINQGVFINDVLDYVYENFRPVIPYDRMGFSLIEDDGKVLRAHWSRSDSASIQIGNGYAQPLKGSSLERILQTGEPRVINDLEAHLAAHPESAATKLILAEGIRSSLTCPLFALGKAVGFLFFSSNEKNTYKDMHQHLFCRVASQIAMIVEKSRLYEDLYNLNHDLMEARNALAHQATHDGLTKLWNRGAILELLEKELARAKRAQRGIAVIMADVDRFKQINDSFGHLAGDDVLRAVAARLAEASRKEDSVGRYGGEEFLVILSTSDLSRVEATADRYLNQVASSPVHVADVQIQVTVSVGVGVAMDPNAEGVTATNLIKMADAALYRAKDGGRNRIEVSTA
ncbi:MAG: GGDEF domain-containing protein [Candidatus Hydrogenedentes bacterium]|nr:GGDEF domain-containing protein [Candidatus Hydrogenedentota bacterium]